MNKIYLITILIILFVIISYNIKENFENKIHYNIQNYYGSYLTVSSSLQTVSPYLLTTNKILANNFYIDNNDNLLDSGNNFVRYYSNNLVINFGFNVKVDIINNNYYLYHLDENNNKNYINSINEYINNNSNNIKLFTTTSTINDECIFTFTQNNQTI